MAQNPDWVDWYFKSNFEEENISFSYTQVGQENSFTWDTFGEALKMQMEKVYKGVSENRFEVLTLKDTGKWFSNQYKMTPASSITSLEDWQNKGCQSVWYNCKRYRANFYRVDGNVAIRDIQLFDENYADRYLFDNTWEHWAIYDALPIIDGFRWAGNHIKSYFYFVHPKTGEKAEAIINDVSKCGKNELLIKIDIAGNKVLCYLSETGIEINQDTLRFDLLFKYNSLEDTTITSFEKGMVKYYHCGKEYGIKCENAEICEEENGYRIIPKEKNFNIGFWS